MTNKKSLLQDSLQELENIKNESLELAKEQLINESADLLEKKSAALFEKLISEETEGFTHSEEKTVQETDESLDEILSELKKSEEMDSDEDEIDSEEETEEPEEETGEEEIDNSDDEETGEEEMDNSDDEEEIDDSDDEEEIDDSDDEEDIEFGDDEEEMDDSDEEEDDDFMDVDVDDKVLAEAFSNKKNNKSIKKIKQINEGLSEKGMQTIQSWVDKMGERGAAKKLVDTFLAKQTGGMTSSDMGDTATFASGLDDIESFLEEGDFEGAMTAAKDTASDMLHDEGFGSEFGMNENFKRNNTKMKNSKKEVLKDLRDVSFNRLVEAYYNMDETDTFIVKESKYMEEDSYDEGYGNPMMDEEDSYDEGYDVHGGMMDEDEYMDEDLFEDEEGDFHQHARDISYRPKFSGSEKPSMRTAPDGSRYSYGKMGRDTIYPSSEDDIYGSQDEDIMYEVEMGHQDFNMSERMTDDEVSQMLDEMDGDKIMHDVEETSNFSKMQKGAKSSDLEEMFQEMTTQELEEMSALLEDGDGEFEDQGVLPEKRTSKFLHDASDVEEDYSNLTEAEIEEMLDSMNEEDLEEGSAITTQTRRTVGNHGGGNVQGRPERRSNMISEEETEEDMSEIKSLKEKLAKVQKEKESLQEGFVNKVKTLENKVYDVTISALKAGFVNKFLLEHPLRENEKLQIIHRFSNAQTKEQIKETYISLTNEFAKGQTVKDGSMLNESIQNKVGKVHRTDNAVVREKNLINENDESLRFKQLLNYNFGKKK